MCGIIGYVGDPTDNALIDVLMDGLANLKYRGYDSAGIAIAKSALSVHKREGELSELEAVVPDGLIGGYAGIGHTRWSTHGSPSTYERASAHGLRLSSRHRSQLDHRELPRASHRARRERSRVRERYRHRGYTTPD